MFNFILFISSVLFAQKEEDFYATGKYTLDVNFAPAAIFDAYADEMFSRPTVKLRNFSSENKAFSLAFSMNVSGDKVYSGLDGDYDKYSNFKITIAPGLEKHLGEGCLSPYYGFEVPLTYKSANSEIKRGETIVKINNYSGDSYMRVGINAVLGIYFYVYKGVYIGAEFTPCFGYMKYFDTKSEGEVLNKGNNNFSFDPSSSPGLKLGLTIPALAIWFSSIATWAGRAV